MSNIVDLINLADSAFPTGAYGHSWGLEWAIQQGLVSSGPDLENWLLSSTHQGFFTLDVRAAALAWTKAKSWSLERAKALNAELSAFRPGQTQRAAQAQTGRSFVRSVGVSYPGTLPSEMTTWLSEDFEAVQFCLAWGWIGRWLDLELKPWMEALTFAYWRQSIQVGIRLIPLGQDEAFAILGKLSRKGWLKRDWESEVSRPWQSLTPIADAAGLGHANLERRSFRS